MAEKRIAQNAPRLGFIGAGQMARALARGIHATDRFASSQLVAHDPSAEALAAFAEDIAGARAVSDNRAVVAAADCVILAVKPQNLEAAATELAAVPRDHCLFVSILAGVSLATLCERLGTKRIVRVMPNTPCLLGCGASGYATGPGVSAGDRELVQELLTCVGTAVEFEERHLDAVTGLSGSGPAYVYTIIEALSDGGVRMGLPRAAATRLAAQTVLGAARMVLETGDHPSVLRDRVTSPGGTTIAGLQVLERNGIRSAIIDAVEAATDRSRELGS